MTFRRSEVVLPEGIEYVYQIQCPKTNAHTGILTETGAWNVLQTIMMDTAEIDSTGEHSACEANHRLIKIVVR